jgi:hypothetical protein
MKSDLIDISVLIRAQTDMAILVEFGRHEPVWLPLSQIEIAPRDDGKSHIVTLPCWLARDKGMI